MKSSLIKKTRKPSILSKDDILIIQIIEEALKHTTVQTNLSARYISLNYLNLRIYYFHKNHIIIRLKHNDMDCSLSHQDFSKSFRELIGYFFINSPIKTTFPIYRKTLKDKPSHLSQEKLNTLISCYHDFCKRSLLVENL